MFDFPGRQGALPRAYSDVEPQGQGALPRAYSDIEPAARVKNSAEALPYEDADDIVKELADKASADNAFADNNPFAEPSGPSRTFSGAGVPSANTSANSDYDYHDTIEVEVGVGAAGGNLSSPKVRAPVATYMHGT